MKRIIKSMSKNKISYTKRHFTLYKLRGCAGILSEKPHYEYPTMLELLLRDNLPDIRHYEPVCIMAIPNLLMAALNTSAQ